MIQGFVLLRTILDSFSEYINRSQYDNRYEVLFFYDLTRELSQKIEKHYEHTFVLGFDYLLSNGLTIRKVLFNDTRVFTHGVSGAIEKYYLMLFFRILIEGTDDFSVQKILRGDVKIEGVDEKSFYYNKTINEILNGQT